MWGWNSQRKKGLEASGHPAEKVIRDFRSYTTHLPVRLIPTSRILHLLLILTGSISISSASSAPNELLCSGLLHPFMDGRIQRKEK
jgi:hypothetical protein